MVTAWKSKAGGLHAVASSGSGSVCDFFLKTDFLFIRIHKFVRVGVSVKQN